MTGRQVTDAWLSLGEACEHFGISKTTIYQWIADGLPTYRVPGYPLRVVRFREAAEHFRMVRKRRNASRFAAKEAG